MAKRVSQTEALALISAVISGSGGTMSHNALVEQLEADGNDSAVLHVLGLSQSGRIVPEVLAVPNGKPVLQYTLPGGGD